MNATESIFSGDTSGPRLQRVRTEPCLRISPPLSPAEISPATVIRQKMRVDVQKRLSLKEFKSNPTLNSM